MSLRSQPWLRWTREVHYAPMENDGSKIRLVTLFPGDEHDCIRISIHVYDLASVVYSKEPPYEALSYTWQHSEQKALAVIIDSRKCTIPQNLFEFLHQRRSRAEVVTLWIDALCINQLDEVEKGYQIYLMPFIYGGCTTFTVWLGMPCAYSNYAIHQIRHSYHYGIHLKEEEYRSVKQLFHPERRPWWRRLWIVQEVAYGASSRNLDEARLLCGKDAITWTELVGGILKMRKDPSGGVVANLEASRVTVETWQASPRNAVWGIEQYQYLLQLFEANRFRQCSDERDRFVAILPLACHNEDLLGLIWDVRRKPWEAYARIRTKIEILKRGNDQEDDVQSDQMPASYRRVDYWHPNQAVRQVQEVRDRHEEALNQYEESMHRQGRQ